MNRQEDFAALVEQAMLVSGRTHMRPVVEKELLHYDIIYALDNAGLLEKLTFQGGTALRLCYGAPRFSEDLDFVRGVDFSAATLIEIKSILEEYLGKRYGLSVSIKEPREMRAEPEYRDLKIDKWRVSITTSPERKNIPRQRIKLEIGNIPAYSRVPRAIQHNYDFLPDGYRDILVLTETLDEITSDKLISLVNCQRYIRHRDIWDLHWLKQKQTTIVSEYVHSKINDYKISDYPNKLDAMIKRIVDVIRSKGFHDEMIRFLPMDILERTLLKDKFKSFLIEEITNLLLETKGMLLT